MQVSTNVHDPAAVPLGAVVERVRALAAPLGARPVEAELIGLIPAAALAGYPDDVPIRDFDPEQQTIERAARGAAPERPGAAIRLDSGYGSDEEEAPPQAPRHAGRAGRPEPPRRPPAQSRGGQGTRPLRPQEPGRKTDAPPTWRSSITRGVVAAVIFTALLMLIFKRPPGAALGLGAFMLVFYIPAGYYIDTMMWRRRERARIRAGRRSEPRRPDAHRGADRGELLRACGAKAPAAA